ncbi:MAG TPA: phosphonopyruvate decarboxylase [Candidatus Andersenbacteria bacterium]|nr:MAG: Phosphonopyruvate decarboxylase [Parcubacteria group bacterium GW2011_GWA2_45_14]OGY33597.1 MAG: phosphonopyruvate decarboxylase [Candidatus Andersenbacteria bacterium RIFCSPHIGHO2_02_FULL_46_16]OGY36469.1 MAG: phosphonopyruvate decarboxylase [Candidatus Andersenbacteria bacterium RIFCSPLOWO2_02_FULL_46_11]HBE89681.1 phosphonopyruvate decarboxylase [Candidatus Andersenbacteria bacterium]
MITPAAFYRELAKHSISFFAGVPDSLLKDFNAYITDHTPPSRHIIAINEGAAVAAAAGYHLATSGIGLVYLQNSGLGNAANPLISLADPLVYRIPVLLLIGWRGEPGVKDEPQHIKQGAITLSLLASMGIPYQIIDSTNDHAKEPVLKAVKQLTKSSGPVAIVVRKATFTSYQSTPAASHHIPYELTREEAIQIVTGQLKRSDVIISTTGKTSRELFEIRTRNRQSHNRDFLTVGSMGHASQIALGISLARPRRRVICIDGDGAALMHLGSLATIGLTSPPNFRHVILNNGVHDSVGGQATAGFNVDFTSLALSCRYKYANRAINRRELKKILPKFLTSTSPALLEIRLRPGARSDLGRPTTSPLNNKKAFMSFLRA